VAGAGDVAVNRVSPEYFATLGIGLVRGRTFTHAEADAGEPVAIISAATAARVFPGADPIGRPLTIGDGSGGPRHLDRLRPPTTGRVTVIGVAADVRSLDVTRVDEGFLYLPLEKRDAGAATFLRVSRDPAPIIASIGGSIGARRERSASERVVLAGLLADTLATNPRFVVSRMGGLLAALVASFGLVMAAIGVAGMVGYAVTQRTKEIGLRMALGARRGEVLRLIAQDGARPVAAGVAAGLVLATIAARALSSLLFGIQPVDPLSFLGAAAILLLSAAAAVVLPARRATRVDPMIALRHE
jgi:putative ABC transport system permease protein